jgi:hypothetical protein
MSHDEGGGGHHERSWWQAIQAVGEDFVMPAFHAAESIPAVHHAVEHAVPLLGTYMGLADAGLNIYQATQTEGSERWDHIGGAVLGAIGAIPMVGTYTGAAELGWNAGVLGGNAYNEHQPGMGPIDTIMAGNTAAHEHGDYANQMIGSGLHSLWDGASNAVSGAYNWLDQGVRGIYGNPGAPGWTPPMGGF